jgi:acetyl esterase
VPLDPAVNIILDQLNGSAGPKLHDLAPEQARTFFDSMRLPSPEIALERVEDRTLPGPGGEIPVRVYQRDAVSGRPGLVYFHGGGWVIGSLETHDATCRELADRTGCVVVSVDYRLAPEHPYPAAAEDCYAATAWVASNAASLGIDPSRLAVGGDSAGGNLAAVVSLMARDRNGPALRFQLLVYPIADCNFETSSYADNAEGYLLERDAMRWFWDNYVPDPKQRLEPYAAPLRADDLSGLPDALVITAEFDPLRDEGEAYAERLARAGIGATQSRYEGMIHGFFAFGAIVERANEAMAEAAGALRAHLEPRQRDLSE